MRGWLAVKRALGGALAQMPTTEISLGAAQLALGVAEVNSPHEISLWRCLVAAAAEQ